VIAVTPSQDDVQTVLVAFLQSVLPAGTAVIEGQDNRVPEPACPNFVVFTPVQRLRLATNIDDYADALFTGSISGTTLTVTQVSDGVMTPGATVFGTGVAAGTTVTAFVSGTGGIGTYTVSAAQTIPSQPIAAGTMEMTQETDVVFQIDVHSDVVGTSADMAQAIVTAFRDPYAVDFFTALNPAVTPLYADDPRASPFISGEEQYEQRWIVEAHVQANQKLTGFPQQFASALSVGIVVVP
jgi:hypothetical protein